MGIADNAPKYYYYFGGKKTFCFSHLMHAHFIEIKKQKINSRK